ncbi:MAG: DHHA1 domain-containing protein, partial [Bacillota bacterium]
EELRTLGDKLKDQGASVVILGSTKNDRAFLVVMVQKDLADMGVDAREMVKKPAQILGGSGGGRKHLAQSGGKNVTSMDKALQVAAAEAVRILGDISK